MLPAMTARTPTARPAHGAWPTAAPYRLVVPLPTSPSLRAPVRQGGLEPPILAALEPKPNASANSATVAFSPRIVARTKRRRPPEHEGRRIARGILGRVMPPYESALLPLGGLAD